MTTLPRFAAIGLLAILLAGCASQTDQGATSSPETSAAAQTAMPSSTATPSQAPTPTPTPTSTAAAGITDTGVLDIVVGKPVPAGSPSVKWSTKVCGGGAGTWVPTTATSLSHRDRWDFTITPTLSSGTDSTGATKKSPVGVIVLQTDALATAAGIHVGSTLDELKAAYPKFSGIYTEKDKVSASTDLYVLENDTAQVVFEVTRPGTADQVDGSKDNTVRVITVQPASAKAFSVLNGDSYSGCFA